MLAKFLGEPFLCLGCHEIFLKRPMDNLGKKRQWYPKNSGLIVAFLFFVFNWLIFANYVFFYFLTVFLVKKHIFY